MAMGSVARYVNRQVREGIRSGAPGGYPLQANAPATIEKKQGRRPLFDTGTLARNIVHSVTRRGNVVTAAIGPAKFTRHADSRRTVGRIGAFHEFGFVHAGRLASGRMPQFLRRRFLLPVLLTERRNITKLFAREFSAGVARKLRFFQAEAVVSGATGPRRLYAFQAPTTGMFRF